MSETTTNTTTCIKWWPPPAEPLKPPPIPTFTTITTKPLSLNIEKPLPVNILNDIISTTTTITTTTTTTTTVPIFVDNIDLSCDDGCKKLGY
jgi:hypothetical protein